ncbi:ABC transporter substrate-binding protein, partial [Streptomyces anulatus]|uniref:ABC transporter substrate-binding protein n=1 Tax=Streptomyces anulatus TaxID=1892 RepID=UPI00342D3E51
MSTIRIRRSTPVALVLSATLLVTACGGPARQPTAVATSAAGCDPQGVKIVAEYAPQGDVAAKLAKTKVEKAYPGLTVTLKMTNTAGYDQLTQQIVTDIAAGARPDVAMVGLGQIRFWADRYRPQPIDPATLNASYDRRFLAIGTVGGKVYVAPFQVSVPVLYTNTALTKAAGVTSAPSTTGELIANAKRIKAASGAAPVQVPRDVIADWVLQAMIQSGGGTFVNPDGTPGFDNAEGRRGLAFYEQLGAQRLQDPVAFADALKMFGTGKLAYLISTPAQAAATRKTIGDAFPWTITAMPVPDGGTASLPAGGNGWMVLSQDACRAAYAGELVK